MPPKAATRTLWLLRHAKTVTNPPAGGADFDRVLAPRGRRDGTALGRLFAGKGEGLGPALKTVPRPKVALVSPAARTRATADLAFADMADPPECFYYDGLYGADPDEVLAYVHGLPHVRARRLHLQGGALDRRHQRQRKAGRHDGAALRRLTKDRARLRGR